jgi:drug/metabolite transporter (DMT)-like permease
VTVILALLAAVSYGVSDFTGGLASRRRAAVTVLLTSYPVGAVFMCMMLLLLPGQLGLRTAALGAAGGVAGMLGVILMYSALAVAPMNVVSPITAVLAATVPVLYGVVIGERPRGVVWLGIALGIGAVLLVSRAPADHPHGPVPTRVLLMALASGVGFGLYFVCLAGTDHGSGAWPVVISRVTSAVLILPLAWRTGRLGVLHGRLLALSVVTGIFDAAANLFFLIASRHGYVSLASVITSLYPAVTVLLAAGVLRERAGRLQQVGLGLAAVSVVLITY